MNRTKKFLHNSSSTALMQIVTMIVGFIIPRIMLQTYGSEINGLVSSISQFLSYFNLVEAGLSGAAVYALYKPLAEGNHKEISAVVSAAKRFYTLSGFIFVSLTLGLAVIYPIFIKTNAIAPLQVGLLVLVLGVSGALEFFTMAKYRVLLSADQKTYVISIAFTIQIILNTLIIVVLSHIRVNIVILRAVAVLSIFICSIILASYVTVKYKYINYKENPNNEALKKRWDALYMQLLGAAQVGGPVIIATIYTNLKMVSVYTIYNMILTGINGVLSIFFTGISASFGDVIAQNKQNTLQKAYREFEFFYYVLVSIVYSVLVVVIMPFIRIYTKGINDINYDMPIIGFLFVLNGLFSNIKTPQDMLMISAGLYKETRLHSTIQGLITIVGGIMLVPILGIAGILMASAASNIFRCIVQLFFIPRNVTKLRVRDSGYRMMRVILVVAIVWISFMDINPTLYSYFDWVIFSSIVGVYTCTIILVLSLLFERKEMKNVSNRICSLISRGN